LRLPRRALALGLIATGCAEMRRPPPPEPPGVLTGGVLLRPDLAVLERAAQDFASGGVLPAGRPAEATVALARLVWVAGAAAPGGPLSEAPATELFALARAVEEAQAAFAIAPGAPREGVVSALLAARAALLVGDAAGAARALGPPSFRDARPAPLARLAEPPPVPTAALALPPLLAFASREAAGRDVGPTGLIDQNAVTGAGMGVPQIR
jgi:hypothetical protein